MHCTHCGWLHVVKGFQRISTSAQLLLFVSLIIRLFSVVKVQRKDLCHGLKAIVCNFFSLHHLLLNIQAITKDATETSNLSHESTSLHHSDIWNILFEAPEDLPQFNMLYARQNPHFFSTCFVDSLTSVAGLYYPQLVFETLLSFTFGLVRFQTS